jgi:hypothetical protein
MTQRLPKARQLKPVWQRTAALLMEAHASGKVDDLEHATGQLRRALDAEGWTARQRLRTIALYISYLGWLGNLDSNQDSRSQSPMFYR